MLSSVQWLSRHKSSSKYVGCISLGMASSTKPWERTLAGTGVPPLSTDFTYGCSELLSRGLAGMKWSVAMTDLSLSSLPS